MYFLIQLVFRQLCQAMPQAEVSRIPDAGHGAARDNPAVFNRLAMDFLRRHVAYIVGGTAALSAVIFCLCVWQLCIKRAKRNRRGQPRAANPWPRREGREENNTCAAIPRLTQQSTEGGATIPRVTQQTTRAAPGKAGTKEHK
jgi:hypothetical protein